MPTLWLARRYSELIQVHPMKQLVACIEMRDGRSMFRWAKEEPCQPILPAVTWTPQMARTQENSQEIVRTVHHI
jgi:uncharacterized protein involved in tolerance to divalent cations